MLEQTQDLSDLRDLSRVGARVGITTGATLSGLSLAIWFLGKKRLGAGYKDTFDQSDWCLVFLFAKHGSHSCVCQNPGSRGKHS